MVLLNLLGPLHDAESVPRLYGDPRMLEFYMQIPAAVALLSLMPLL